MGGCGAINGVRLLLDNLVDLGSNFASATVVRLGFRVLICKMKGLKESFMLFFSMQIMAGISTSKLINFEVDSLKI